MCEGLCAYFWLVNHLKKVLLRKKPYLLMAEYLFEQAILAEWLLSLLAKTHGSTIAQMLRR
jgi:hypothetical protein